MLIAARNAILADGAALPYDAEVEYLESANAQYINTGVILSGDFSFDVKTIAAPYAEWGYYPGLMGCSESGIGDSYFRPNNVTYMQWRAYGVNNQDMRSNLLTTLHQYTMNVSDGYVSFYIDGTFIRRAAVTTKTYTVPVWLFSINKYPYAKYSGKIYGAKITRGGVDAWDGIPVRVGSGSSAVGYMYDRVSGTLFGNAGTGAFVIGPDK